MIYILKIDGKEIETFDTAWNAMRYADYYYPEGYTIESRDKKEICGFCGKELKEYYLSKYVMLCSDCDVVTDIESGIMYLQ